MPRQRRWDTSSSEDNEDELDIVPRPSRIAEGLPLPPREPSSDSDSPQGGDSPAFTPTVPSVKNRTLRSPLEVVAPPANLDMAPLVYPGSESRSLTGSRDQAIPESQLRACPKCGRTFTRRDNLKRHLRTAHKNKTEGKKFRCATCDTKFGRLHDARRHVSRSGHSHVEPCLGEPAEASGARGRGSSASNVDGAPPDLFEAPAASPHQFTGLLPFPAALGSAMAVPIPSLMDIDVGIPSVRPSGYEEPVMPNASEKPRKRRKPSERPEDRRRNVVDLPGQFDLETGGDLDVQGTPVELFPTEDTRRFQPRSPSGETSPPLHGGPFQENCLVTFYPSGDHLGDFQPTLECQDDSPAELVIDMGQSGSDAESTSEPMSVAEQVAPSPEMPVLTPFSVPTGPIFQDIGVQTECKFACKCRPKRQKERHRRASCACEHPLRGSARDRRHFPSFTSERKRRRSWPQMANDFDLSCTETSSGGILEIPDTHNDATLLKRTLLALKAEKLQAALQSLPSDTAASAHHFQNMLFYPDLTSPETSELDVEN